MSVQFIIGIDGGGTKTNGRIKNIKTGQFFETQGGASSLTNDFTLATKNITTILNQLMFNAKCAPEQVSVVIGTAGGGVASQAAKLKKELDYPFANLEISPYDKPAPLI